MRSLIKLVMYAVCACGMLWFLVGVVRFMDGPIHPCGVDRYCGKFGWPHTKEEYEAFRFWVATLFIIWPGVMASAGILKWMQLAERKKVSDRQEVG